MRALRARWGGCAGFSPLLFSLGAALFCLVLWAGWTGYTQMTTTQSTVTQVVVEGLGAGLITPATAGGGYENEPYGGGGPPTLDLTGVETMAATVAHNAVVGSTTTLTSAGFTWTLPAAVAHAWNLTGPVQVSQVAETSSAPWAVTATISAPESLQIWGFQTLPMTFQTTVTVPIAGQTAPNQFQTY